MSKLIIFGGSGFIGKNLMQNLESKYDITIIDKYIDEDYFSQFNVSYLKYDFMENKNLRDILQEAKPAYMVNLISLVNAANDLTLFQQMLDLNFNVLMMIYEASKDLKSLKLFINMGTAEEYGNIEGEFTEDMREAPGCPYGLAKQLTTNSALMLYRNFQYPITVIRPSNLFGRYQSGKKFLPYIKSQLLKNHEIKTTLGEQKRDFLSVHDFSWCVDKILKKSDSFKGEIVNIGSGERYSLKEIIENSRSILSSKSEVKFGAVPYKKDEIMDMNYSIKKFKNILGYEVKFDFYKALSEFLKEGC